MANKKAASDAQLGDLHNKVAKVMTDALTVIEKAQERYIELEEDAQLEPMPQVSAPLLGVITKFLADNNITCNVEDSEAMSDLQRTLEEKRNARAGKKNRVGNVIPFAAEA